MNRSASNGHSFSNGNGCGNTHANGASPATVTICGVHLGAGDNHWWMLV